MSYMICKSVLLTIRKEEITFHKLYSIILDLRLSYKWNVAILTTVKTKKGKAHTSMLLVVVFIGKSVFIFCGYMLINCEHASETFFYRVHGS